MNSVIADSLTFIPKQPDAKISTPFEHQSFDEEMASTLATFSNTRRFDFPSLALKNQENQSETTTKTTITTSYANFFDDVYNGNLKPIEPTPFKITESLEIALLAAPDNSTKSILTFNNEFTKKQMFSQPQLLSMKQEEYPKKELIENKLYSWEQKRGEKIIPDSLILLLNEHPKQYGERNL